MKKYCVIGKSLSHTLSPQIHREFGLDYSAVELCDESELEAFINNLEFDGFNITIPYKQTIIKYLDKVEQTAKEIGAVNTVVNFHGKLYGYNTDLEGLRYALRQAQIELRDKAVMILGSGGASKTAQYLAKKEGAKSVTVVSRSGEANYENCYEKQDTEVIINTTPVGMMPNENAIPLDISKFENLESVYDLIYNPLRTRLIIEAKDRELRASNGLNMLVEQARLARDLFTEEST
ncbi:MAG TPA: shikimate dehydrogenase, partial [Clostridia bacterium]|nr:shikimate dehydrogenase [Clostridia bacterium]